MAQEGKFESAPVRGHSEGFPNELVLPNGRNIALRLMGAADREQILTFARSLPPDDLLFLRTDITEPAIIDQWISDLERANSITVLAETKRELAGYATLHLEQARWTRRVGEIRVQVAPAFRGYGLGRRLTLEIFNLGQSRGIKKMAAMMTPDQTGARAAFEKLGFQVEALLQDWVVDRGGRPRDLLIMSYDLEGLSHQA
ncbi:MAG: GNAT family N-acetyltransferase [Deltaproteobacteria bacterium]|nr:GNAT family N-acetyltransferase [Deltaproteobacteria bacterium]